MTLKKYTINVKDSNYWEEIHDLLCHETHEENIPDRAVTCWDDKLHSSTRGTFILHGSEVELLKNDPRIDWIELSPQDNPEKYPKPFPATYRWGKEVKIYRDLDVSGIPATNPTVAELDRTTWATKRVGILTNGDFWNNVTGNPPSKNTDLTYDMDGKHVDIIIHDSGVLQYHPEFIDENGQSRVRDIVLDGPFYIDPNYFITNNLTYIKPDGRIGITTASAESWWENGSNRSAQFSSIGTVLIPSTYTVARSMGGSLDGTNSLTSGHGTACAGLAAGKNFGLAFRSNIWNMPGISDNVGMDIEINYDLMKLFHKYKPVNPITGRKNPTIVNGSWGYQAAFLSSSNVGYSFRGSTGTFTGNASVTNQITAMKEGLSNQVSGAYRSWSSSSRSSSIDTAAAEMIAEGVIYVAAAGNNNQRLGIGATDIDRNNYMEDEYFGAGDSRFGGLNCPSNHRDWMNPQGIGFDSGNDFHPVICVGAMDEVINTNSSERKASYSNNGPGIDVWAPADETLSAGTNSVTGYTDYQRYDDGRFYDCYFNGTSAAAPVVTGVIALYLQSNPTATAAEVKNWIKTQGSKIVPISQYQDETTDDSTTAYWTGLYNMRGAEKRILFNPFTNNTIPKIEGISMFGITFSQF
jgi:subtilisin family serine protease